MRPCLAAVLLVFLAGCRSATHVVRLDTGQGAARVHKPRGGQQPVKLGKEAFKAALAKLGPDVKPAAHPLRHARQLMFEAPWQYEEYLKWTGRHLEPDASPGQVRPGQQALDEFTRDYLSWCGRRRPGATPGDCLRLLTEHALLDADGRYTLAMAIALDSVWEETGEALGQMADREAVLTTVTAAMALYMMLWVLPEPTSKGLAAVLTAGLMAYLGVETLWTLIGGWVALVEEVNRAPGFVALREAGRRYGKVMGQNAARLFVMLVTAAIGNTAGLASKSPGLPAYSEAAVLAETQGGFHLAAVGQVQAVAVSAEGFSVVLAPGAVAMTAQGQNSSQEGPRMNGPPPERPFKNLQPEHLSAELAEARQLGVTPVGVTEPQFLRYVNAGRIKWVVTQEGELKVVPHTWRGVEIKHSVASAGRPVLAAGEADISIHGSMRVGVEITPRSGHFLNGASESVSAQVLEVGRQAFARFGITFPP